ncbi:hypothetical protein BDP27DRAFT_1413720 [Rhodocollybia butyracea]|uniref:Uncharacterized protein n=1 Tax=Rhodocollybia butyracea TaxID=206335 RepID=A0A9P5Q2Q6_9AGAR|nr:hypothetical protein BDP27DRAFT_1413720 [Rhodocollybia butyracea]
MHNKSSKNAAILNILSSPPLDFHFRPFVSGIKLMPDQERDYLDRGGRQEIHLGDVPVLDMCRDVSTIEAKGSWDCRFALVSGRQPIAIAVRFKRSSAKPRADTNSRNGLQHGLRYLNALNTIFGCDYSSARFCCFARSPVTLTNNPSAGLFDFCCSEVLVTSINPVFTITPIILVPFMQLKLSAVLVIVLLAAWGGQALNINRAAGALPATVNRAPDAVPLTDMGLDVESPPELHARKEFMEKAKKVGKKLVKAGLHYAADILR